MSTASYTNCTLETDGLLIEQDRRALGALRRMALDLSRSFFDQDIGVWTGELQQDQDALK
jgi:hypothetical protein